MSETVPRHRSHARRSAARIGDEALHFARWFTKSKYALMDGFLSELDDAPEERDPATLRARFIRAVTHAKRVQLARTLVTLVLAAGVLATAGAAVARVVFEPANMERTVGVTTTLLDHFAAYGASFTVALVALRLAFDRYLGLVDVTATFLAMQLATAPRA